jgi:tetratricopeptide (TPR) repeat protein
MTRSAFFLLLCVIAIIVIGSLSRGANPGGEGQQPIENALAVQKTVLLARDYLQASAPKKAVDVLEANLGLINGDRKYLALLRDAYRSYIRDLALAHQQDLAEVYQKRLKILEDYEANRQAASAPGATATAQAAPTTVAGAVRPTVFLRPKVNTYLTHLASSPSSTTAAAPVPPLARPDPFDAANEIKLATRSNPQPPNPGKALVAKADEEFIQKRYAAAKQLYEQAYKADTKAMTDEGRGRWAYCQLQLVVEQANRFPEQPCDWAKLELDVRTAVAAAPQLSGTADMILGELAKRRGGTPSVIRGSMPAVAVKHKPRGDHGWLVAETTNFRIFHNQTQEFAESVAQAAEATRSQMLRKWFGKDGEDWSPQCDIYLHGNAADYSQHTGQNAASPGHSRIDLDPNAGRVVVRQVHLRCDNTSLLDAVLPHETTHVVLAGQFGSNRHVPRWIDEGIAVLTEPADKVQQHRTNLVTGLQNKKLIPLKTLLQMEDYPPPAQISVFYAQSVALVDFLTKEKGPVVLTQFAREALQSGYEPALRKYYGYQTIAELQDRFTERVLGGISSGQPTNGER